MSLKPNIWLLLQPLKHIAQLTRCRQLCFYNQVAPDRPNARDSHAAEARAISLWRRARWEDIPQVGRTVSVADVFDALIPAGSHKFVFCRSELGM